MVSVAMSQGHGFLPNRWASCHIQTSTRISGYPVRNSLQRGFPEYDPWQFDAERMLDNGEADALLWISSFQPEKTPPASAEPTIFIGHAAMHFEH